MSEHKVGDLVTFAITGKIESIHGDSVVVYAHGVEIPILASQIGSPTQELAQKILELIAEADRSLHDKPDQQFLAILDADTLQSLKNDIKQLCQEEAAKS